MTDTFDEQLATYLAGRRWFAGKGRDFTIRSVHPLPWLSEDPEVRVEVVTVEYADGGSDSYSFLMSYLDQPDDDYAYALIGSCEGPEGDGWVYDGVHHKRATSALLAGFLAGRQDKTLSFYVEVGAELPAEGTVGSVLTAEQSNTSIAYGEQAILKLFRRISAGFNPDVEILDALTRRGDEHIAPLLGWIEATWSDEEGEPHSGHLGMLQVFFRTATDGWDIALASVRDLLIEEDLHPDEVGGDFASEAERLGAATAAVHRDLAELFETRVWGSPELGGLSTAMQRRLDNALDVVPQLREVESGLRATYDAVAELDEPVPVQRIHGDLHLGQTLRTVKGWKLIDFEGEPAKPLHERLAPDSPLRDVAGMLRSFDYAAGSTRRSFGSREQFRYRADEWSQRNRRAFLAGYGQESGTDVSADGQTRTLLDAYEADKAVYEAVYEARHRPTWISIPLEALDRFGRRD